MFTRSISNVKMCELKFKNTNIQIITYDLNEKNKEDYVVCGSFFEGSDDDDFDILHTCSKSKSEKHSEILRYVIREAVRYTKLFRESTQSENDSFVNDVESKLRLVMPDNKVSKRMWGMRAGVINYNDKKYYAIAYYTGANSVRSFVLREDGLKMEGVDTIHYERAVSDAIIKGEGINKVEFKSKFKGEDRELTGNCIDDEDYEKEDRRIKRTKNKLKKLEKDISKEMRIVFYANSNVYWSDFRDDYDYL